MNWLQTSLGWFWLMPHRASIGCCSKKRIITHIELSQIILPSSRMVNFYWSSRKRRRPINYRYSIDGRLVNQITTGDHGRAGILWSWMMIKRLHFINVPKTVAGKENIQDRSRRKGNQCITEAARVHLAKMSKVHGIITILVRPL